MKKTAARALVIGAVAAGTVGLFPAVASAAPTTVASEPCGGCGDPWDSPGEMTGDIVNYVKTWFD